MYAYLLKNSQENAKAGGLLMEGMNNTSYGPAHKGQYL
jgi:hypothetical protein